MEKVTNKETNAEKATLIKASDDNSSSITSLDFSQQRLLLLTPPHHLHSPTLWLPTLIHSSTCHLSSKFWFLFFWRVVVLQLQIIQLPHLKEPKRYKFIFFLMATKRFLAHTMKSCSFRTLLTDLLKSQLQKNSFLIDPQNG